MVVAATILIVQPASRRKGDRNDTDDDSLINPLSEKQLSLSQSVYYQFFFHVDAIVGTNLEETFSIFFFSLSCLLFSVSFFSEYYLYILCDRMRNLIVNRLIK